MARPRERLSALVVAGLLSVPVHHVQPQDQKAALLTAERAMSELSRDSGLAPAFTSGLHSDAVLLWPDAPLVVGSAEVQQLLAVLPRDSVRLTWQPLAVDLARDSALGVTWGVAVAGARTGPASPQIGRYIAAWRRDGSRWSVAALVFSGITIPLPALPRGIPFERRAIDPRGTGQAFVAADRAFAQLAADSGAGIAFERWASPDAVVSGGRGLLTRGPKAIGRAVEGRATWRWHPVAAGASGSGDLGWTVGEATIAPPEGKTSHSKYLTIWTRADNGVVRFLTDGGNARPATP